MAIQIKQRGCDRQTLNALNFGADQEVFLDLTPYFEKLLELKLRFYSSCIFPNTPVTDVRSTIPIIRTDSVSNTDFYPLDYVLEGKSLNEETCKFINTGGCSYLSEPITDLADALANHINMKYAEAVLEYPDGVALVLSPADTVRYAGTKGRLAYLFFVGSQEKGFTLQSETSFKFIKAE